LFYAGQAISLIGTWIQQIALSWLVYRMTGSAFMLGLVTFASQLPMLIFSPLAGAIADRHDRRRLLIGTECFAILQALALGLLTLSGMVEVWHLVALGFLYGSVMAFETSARQSLISQMVPAREDLPNAIALNSFLMNSGRLVGPSIAGVMLVFIAEGWCFLINAASFTAVIIAALAMRIAPRAAAPTHALLSGVAEAAGYAWRTPTIRVLLVTVGLISLTASPYPVLMPVFARDIFGGGAHTLGFLIGCAGLGAVIGTVFLATRTGMQQLPRLVGLTAAVAGLALIAIGVSRVYELTLLLMGCLGFGIIVTAASCNMMLQTIVEEDKRGRIISFYTMAFLGLAPFGGLASGLLASHAGARAAAIACGASCLVGALLLSSQVAAIRTELLKSLSRPIGT